MTAHLDTPPTVPGPLQSTTSTQPVYRNLALVGMAMHVIPLTITCFAIPLAMGSNIWPIAGVFWCALAGPVGAVAGMLGGLLLRNANRVLAMTVLASTAALLSIAAGIVIWHNR